MTGLIWPILFSQIFAYFIRSDSAFSTSLELSGAPFILASLMLLSAAVIAWRTTKGRWTILDIRCATRRGDGT